MLQIIPAILSTSESDYKQKLLKIESNRTLSSGWIQIDFMDNKFVQNKSIDCNIVKKYPTNLKIEAQLMVEYPESWIDELVRLDVARIIFPLELTSGITERIRHVKDHNKQVGLSVNPETAIENLTPFLSTIDSVLVMSVRPGFGGQQFIPESFDKVRSLRSLSNRLKIGVDGGVNESVIKQLADAGADYVVIGSHLLEGEIDDNLNKLKKALED